MFLTVDRNGTPGHPTKRMEQVHKLRKRGQARLTGGGLSGTPVIVQFLTKTFDSGKTVSRKFVRVIDPGYEKAGYAVCEVAGTTLKVLLRGDFGMADIHIRGGMQDRKAARRARRSSCRFKAKRLSAQQGRVLTKFKKPRYVRSTDKTNATLQHAVDVHINLYGVMQKMCHLPVFQTLNVMESNSFDVRTMTSGALRTAKAINSRRGLRISRRPASSVIHKQACTSTISYRERTTVRTLKRTRYISAMAAMRMCMPGGCSCPLRVRYPVRRAVGPSAP